MPKTQTTYERTITCYACDGVGNVEGNDCLCAGWGFLRVRVLGPCDRNGTVKTTAIEDDPEVTARLRRLLARSEA